MDIIMITDKEGYLRGEIVKITASIHEKNVENNPFVLTITTPNGSIANISQLTLNKNDVANISVDTSKKQFEEFGTYTINANYATSHRTRKFRINNNLNQIK